MFELKCRFHGIRDVSATPPLGEVTLVTGDVVSVGVEPGGAYTAEVTRTAPRGDGRTVLYSTVRQDGALYVYPSDALGLLGAGRLDRRLFDVEYLVRNGYADAASGELPLIVQYPAAGGVARRAAALPAATAVTELSSVDGAAIEEGIEGDEDVFGLVVVFATPHRRPHW